MKNQARLPKRLKLHRETLCALEAPALAGIVGGASGAVCNNTRQPNCPTNTLCANTVCLICTASG
jgi:hypothetical protein